MSRTIMLIHGAWLTPSSFGRFRSRYEAAGYTVLAPAWPHMDRPVEALRAAPSPAFARLTLGQIVDHFADLLAQLPEPAILVGHSYGGLVVQMLLDRGLGLAGVSIDPGPAAGIKPGPKALAAALPVFLAWAGWNRALTMKPGAFNRSFANRLAADEQADAYARFIVPAPGRIYYQSVFGLGSGIDWGNPERPPLLLVSGEADRTVEPSMVRQNLARYRHSPATTDFLSFPDRDHFLIASAGWEDIADAVLAWAEDHGLVRPSKAA